MHWGHFKKHRVTDIILHFSSVQISIVLLTTLNSLKSISYGSNLFNSLRYDMQAIVICSSGYAQHKGDLQGLIWCHANTSLVTVIIGKLYQWKVIILVTTKIKNATIEHVF